ncbi:MAG: hypothetical protein MUP71_12920 [Candidatus Aminicenantes bacterium]|nr:hypothetical protein [Candidatus Aminicenantes bacterium]
MGEKLAKIFKIIEEKTGNPGRIRLAAATGFPKKDAEEMKDKPDVVEKFRNVASDILGYSIDDIMPL